MGAASAAEELKGNQKLLSDYKSNKIIVFKVSILIN